MEVRNKAEVEDALIDESKTERNRVCLSRRRGRRRHDAPTVMHGAASVDGLLARPPPVVVGPRYAFTFAAAIRRRRGQGAGQTPRLGSPSGCEGESGGMGPVRGEREGPPDVPPGGEPRLQLLQGLLRLAEVLRVRGGLLHVLRSAPREGGVTALPRVGVSGPRGCVVGKGAGIW